MCAQSRVQTTPSAIFFGLFWTSETAVEAAPLKTPAIDAGETSGIHNMRSRPTSPEETMYIDAGRENLI